MNLIQLNHMDMLIINKKIALNFVISPIDFLSHSKNNAMKAE